MKKVIFSSLIVFLALLLVTCDGFTDPGSLDNETPSVQYSADGRSVTLRLDGGGTDRKLSRSLTDSMAKTGHDFFEVVFDDGAGHIARASWELGNAAGIKNVPRDIAYGITIPATGPKAVLFVGKKSDKSLLAIGTISEVDGITAIGTTQITSTSTSVTFKVTALTAKADAHGATATATSTFLTGGNPSYTTAAAGTTLNKTATYEGKPFPLYHFDAGQAAIAATYTIGLNGVTPATYSNYFNGVFVKIGGPVAGITYGIKTELRTPRIPIGGGNYFDFPDVANATTVAITNNTATATIFANSITMNFKTDNTGTNKGLISFCFEIPVYAIDDTPVPGAPDAIYWKIKPGVGTYQYDLDDGTGNAGGSLLLGIGDYTTDYLTVIPTFP